MDIIILVSFDTNICMAVQKSVKIRDKAVLILHAKNENFADDYGFASFLNI